MNKSPSQRQLRVAQAIKREIASILVINKFCSRDFPSAIISVTDAIVTPDLKLAKVFISIMNSDENQIKEIFKILKSIEYEVRRMITPKLNLRYSPTVNFMLDDSIHKINKIEKILGSVNTTDSL